MFAQHKKPPQPDIFVEEGSESPLWQPRAPEADATSAHRRSIVSKIRNQDWLVGVLIVLCDVVCWVLLYGFVGYVRRDAFFVTPFEFVLVDCVSLLVLLQALYIVGGDYRNTETPGLTYTAADILAVARAGLISAVLISYAAA